MVLYRSILRPISSEIYRPHVVAGLRLHVSSSRSEPGEEISKHHAHRYCMALGIDAINYNNNQVSRHGHELIPWISAVPVQFLQAPANARHPDLHSTLRKPRRSGTHKGDSSSSAYLICLGGGGGLLRRVMSKSNKPPTGRLQPYMKALLPCWCLRHIPRVEKGSQFRYQATSWVCRFTHAD
jgi:hypothetical protein